MKDNIKTAEEILEQLEDPIWAMKEYASQFIDLAAEKAYATIVSQDEETGEEYESDPGYPCWASVDKESILKVKQLIK